MIPSFYLERRPRAASEDEILRLFNQESAQRVFDRCSQVFEQYLSYADAYGNMSKPKQKSFERLIGFPLSDISLAQLYAKTVLEKNDSILANTAFGREGKIAYLKFAKGHPELFNSSPPITKKKNPTSESLTIT